MDSESRSSQVLKREMPYSVEAEQSVIGCMFIDKEAIITAAGMLTREDFYERQYGMLFQAILDLFEEGKSPDGITVTEKLKQMNAPEEIMNPVFLGELINKVPTRASIKHYCEFVKDYSLKRKLINVVNEIAGEAYSGEWNTNDLFMETEKRIFDLVQKRGNKDIVPIDQVILETLDHIQEAAKNKSYITGIPSGFVELDRMTAGFQKANLILIAARPSMGKTAFALNIASNALIRSEKTVMMFSLEMSNEDLIKRMMSMDSGVNSDRLRTANLEDKDWDDLIVSAGRFAKSKFVIDDTPGITVAEMRSKCRRQKLEHGLDMVIVDYLQLMSGGKGYNNANRQQEISDISRALKSLARELNCPVIALSQLSRAVEQRTDHKPMLSDLRESGAIEQDADLVMFIYREDYYDKETARQGIADIIVAKQRNGAVGKVELKWIAAQTKFISLETMIDTAQIPGGGAAPANVQVKVPQAPQSNDDEYVPSDDDFDDDYISSDSNMDDLI
ncbi:MAG: replicative DNA helicase [Lachnospiraceae bacterium]|nr:replicative DNA helicase [Lachnospiraceae bacterium]